MYQITLGIDGMMCGMCESHINDAVRTINHLSVNDFVNNVPADVLMNLLL